MPVPDTPATDDELGFDTFAVPLARSTRVRLVGAVPGALPEGIRQVLLELDEPTTIAEGTRFTGTLGAGVVTRLVK